MREDDDSLIELGRVGAPFGVRGWVKLRSFTDPPERLLEHRRVHVCLGGVWSVRTVEASGRSGGQLTAKLSGVADRDQAQGLRGAPVGVPRQDLPPRKTNDYLRADLIGCEVLNLAGIRLGVVGHFIDMPEQGVMVVLGPQDYWVPAVPRHLRRVDLQARQVVVDWAEESGIRK